MVFPIAFAIGACLLAGTGLALVYIARLIWSKLLKWFQESDELYYQPEDHVAFTLQNKLASGQYKTVQGVLNRHSDEIVEGREIKSDNLDSQIHDAHRYDELVIWE
ncbi:MAG: hypothetical protein WA828_16195 [Coleofasciculaceae cyanobacterium]